MIATSDTLDEYARQDLSSRLAQAGFIIRITIFTALPFVPVFAGLRIYAGLALVLALVLFESLLLRALSGPHHLLARVTHCLLSTVCMVFMTWFLGYRSRESLLLLSVLVAPIQIYTPTERAAMWVSLAAPALSFLAMEGLNSQGLLPGYISLPTQRMLGGAFSLIMIGGLIKSMLDLYHAHATAARALWHARESALDASRHKSQFLANMSHEIRTPMNGVLGMTALALDCPEARGELREHLETIQLSATSLLGIVNDILDLSKIEARKLDLERVPFGLQRLLAEILRGLSPRAQEKGLALRLSLAPDVPAWVLGDPTRLRQVLTNLIGNAVKFTERGEVTLSVEAAGAQVLHFAVRDTGIGIPPDHLARIFDAFTQADGSTTRRFGGTGLGLTISRDLVRLMGGDLLVDSAPGHGSCFHFTAELPRTEPPAGALDGDAKELTAGALHAELPGLRILLAEDNVVNTKLAVRMLQKQGHTVVHAPTGVEAVAEAERGDFALILMDMQMPQMDGLTATRHIRASEAAHGRPRVPIVALTANAMKSDEALCLAAGMDAFLAKPFDPRALHRTIAHLTHHAAAPTPAPAPSP